MIDVKFRMSFSNASPTVVSAYYAFPSKFPQSVYLESLWQFLNAISANLVLFMETEEMAALARKMTSKDNLRVEVLPISQWTCVQQMGQEFWKNQLAKDPERGNHRSWQLGALWCEKMYFVNRVMQSNPFQSTDFAWCDAGIIKGKQENVKLLKTFATRPFEKQHEFLMLQVGPNPGTMYSKLTSHEIFLGGGILAASAMVWPWAIRAYESAIHRMVQRNEYVFKDQYVWADAYFYIPELFFLYQPRNGYRVDGNQDWFALLQYL